MESTFCVRSRHVSKGSTSPLKSLPTKGHEKTRKRFCPLNTRKIAKMKYFCLSLRLCDFAGKIFSPQRPQSTRKKTSLSSPSSLSSLLISRSSVPHSAFVSSRPTLSHPCPMADWDGETIDTIDVTVIFCLVPRISKTFRATEVNKK